MPQHSGKYKVVSIVFSSVCLVPDLIYFSKLVLSRLQRFSLFASLNIFFVLALLVRFLADFYLLCGNFKKLCSILRCFLPLPRACRFAIVPNKLMAFVVALKTITRKSGEKIILCQHLFIGHCEKFVCSKEFFACLFLLFAVFRCFRASSAAVADYYYYLYDYVREFCRFRWMNAFVNGWNNRDEWTGVCRCVVKETCWWLNGV